MPTNLIRYVREGAARWGVLQGTRIAPLDGDYPRTADLITAGEHDLRAAADRAPSVSLKEVTLASPVTAPARIICQGANYRQHMRESGLDPDAKRFNMFFTKSDAAIQGPVGAIVRPERVKLLDYEIELALVFRKKITTPVTVTSENLHEYVFGVTIANDVSARDVQIPETQFHKGKSYRGFCPLGPHLVVLEPSELRYLDALDLRLTVNGEVRQQDSTHNLVFKPAETISELSTFSDVSPGDVLLTGTPAGCALRVPPRLVRSLLQLILSEAQVWSLFRRTQGRRREYLQPGDQVRATIVSSDGHIQLGEQQHTVEAAHP